LLLGKSFIKVRTLKEVIYYLSPSPFSSMAANMFFLSSSPRAGRLRPSFLGVSVRTLMRVTNSLWSTFPSLSASAAWKAFQWRK